MEKRFAVLIKLYNHRVVCVIFDTGFLSFLSGGGTTENTEEKKSFWVEETNKKRRPQRKETNFWTQIYSD